jgi:murein DD-endopeptidase MepM/ murein hydrolase activator NlpD
VVRIDERGVRSVAARLVFLPLAGQGQILRVALGSMRTGRSIVAAWPQGATLAPGQYTVRLHAKGPRGETLLRRARAAGKSTLTVSAPPPPPPPAPAPAPAAAPVPAPAPTPAPVLPGGVFPVVGPHGFGGPDARFGAGRTGHTHQGQDIVAAEGLQIVAPVAGTISYVGYQASAAGYWVAEHAADGRDFFFAHCQKDSTVVVQGAIVGQGAPLCRVGHTGDASGPHLHFEIWVNGWRTGPNSMPLDPLPQLQAWEQQPPAVVSR